MKPAIALGLVAFAAVALALWAEPSEATTICQGGTGPAVANTCQGYAHVSTATGGVASARCFAFRTTNTAPTCTTSGITPTNEAWTMDAGACLVFRYFDTTAGVTPPAAPNKVSVSVKLDDLATNVIVYQSLAAEPANGATFNFCATDTGLITGNPRAGTYRPSLTLVKDNGAGGVGNYNINTDGVATVGSVISFDRSAVRGGMVVASITASSPPGGSMFAYGPSGDELITITSTFTTPNVDNANRETIRNAIIDEATLSMGAVGATVDVDAGSLAENFVADGTFQPANNPFVGAIEITGNAALTGLKWSHIATAGNGATIIRDTDLVAHSSTDITIDPRIVFNSEAAGTFATADGVDNSYLGTCTGTELELFNRGEGLCHNWYLLNARSEKLTRAMTFARRDSANQCSNYGSLSPTAGLYTRSEALETAAPCVSAADITGTARLLRATNTDQSADSGTIFFQSSLLFIDAHLQDSATLVTDDWPTPDAAETLQFFVRSDGMGGDDSDTINLWCGVQGVRQDFDVDTSGGAVFGELKDPTGATRDSATGDTGSNGFTGSPTGVAILATTPLGDDWTGTCTATFAGNTGTDTETFEIGVEGGGGGGGDSLADPLKVFTSPVIINPGETTLIAISASFLDGTARLGAASEIFVTVYDPDGNLEVNSQNPTEVAFGTYTYEFTVPSGSEDFGGWLVLINTTDGADVIGTSNTFFLELDGDLEPVTAFETATTTTGLEFLALIAIVIVAIIVWSRSTDFLLRMAMGVLCLIPALIWLRLAIVSDGPVVASLNAMLALLAGVIGGYMIIRQGIDKFQEA